MIVNVNNIVPDVAEEVSGGVGTIQAHKLLDLFPGSPIKSVALVRLEPGASIGPHSHNGEEDFYFCISGNGIVIDNGQEHSFSPGVLQITRDGETQAIRNTGEIELVFLATLLETSDLSEA